MIFDIDLGYRKAVESASSSQRVSAHVFKNDPVVNVDEWQFYVGGDLVQSVTRGSPDGASVFGCRTGLQQDGSHRRVVVEHAVEAAVDAVVDVVEVRHGFIVIVRQLTTPENARGQREGRRHVITTRFGDYVHSAAVGKVLVQCSVDYVGDLVDG